MTRLYVEDAELYDIAFDWDVAPEADWLVERLGAHCRSVLEPGCGSGRILLELAHRGLEATGLDLSPRMVELARLRLGELGTVFVADMTDFDLGRRFSGAVSPINTLLHLTPAQLAHHLDCMARHLQADARYLVQVGLIEPDQWKPFAGSHWEASRGYVKLTVAWVDEELDAVRGRSRQRSRIEVLEGDRAGEIIEEVHDMTAWTPTTWADAVEASPFGEVATYDGGKSGQWPRVEPTATGGLLWHELARS